MRQCSERPPRVAVPGANLHFANTAAELVNVSVTGALIRLGFKPRLGGEWPLALDLPKWGQVWLNGRVVRCQPDQVAPSLSTRSADYLLGLVFVQPSEHAQAALTHVCGPSMPVSADPDAAPRRHIRHTRIRRLAVSRERQCPECRTTAVLKHALFRYSCKQCGSEFVGFHLGVVRISI